LNARLSAPRGRVRLDLGGRPSPARLPLLHEVAQDDASDGVYRSVAGSPVRTWIIRHEAAEPDLLVEILPVDADDARAVKYVAVHLRGDDFGTRHTVERSGWGAHGSLHAPCHRCRAPDRVVSRLLRPLACGGDGAVIDWPLVRELGAQATRSFKALLEAAECCAAEFDLGRMPRGHDYVERWPDFLGALLTHAKANPSHPTAVRLIDAERRSMEAFCRQMDARLGKGWDGRTE
jgi:hypothetical protein